MIVTVYVVILQLQIKHFPILNLPSFQCVWSFMVNIGFLIGPNFALMERYPMNSLTLIGFPIFLAEISHGS